MRKSLIYVSVFSLILSCGAAKNSRNDQDPNRKPSDNIDAATGEYKFNPIERSMITRVPGENRKTYSEIKALIKSNTLGTSAYLAFPKPILREAILVPEIADTTIICGQATGDQKEEDLTILDRINNCIKLIGGTFTHTWYGSKSGISGEGNWRLVTYVDMKKVWRDDSTGLLWSDIVGVDSFTNALGKAPESLEELETLCMNKPDYKNPALGKIMDSKVKWRLPNKQEVLQAYLNGAGNVLSESDLNIWTASYAGDDKAWAIDMSQGVLSKVNIKTDTNIRCIGVVTE